MHLLYKGIILNLNLVQKQQHSLDIIRESKDTNYMTSNQGKLLSCDVIFYEDVYPFHWTIQQTNMFDPLVGICTSSL